ncbi:MAG TPA: LuxR C-terminal-related transcriptional regulator [Anaerolineaceae bacterium]|nr:LuxR C-terminal-related transcriptional regulator [Anaerolineaceae bacterium]
MAAPILTTKFYIPPYRPNQLARRRLIDQLEEGMELGHRLTLISAPAGAGKTTLLSEWIARRREKTRRAEFCWLQLEEADNDMPRFWTYLISALQTLVPGLGQTALEEIRSARPVPGGATWLEPILTLLLNEIAGLADGLILVLDDYHVLSNPAIHQAIAFWIEHQPPSFHMVFVTRADPPLPLARLRARGQLTELRAADLSFSSRETEVFLNDCMGLALKPEGIQVLAERTEGWIVGLQLAALSMQGRSDTDAFIKAFSGSHHYILEYLTDEVLARQPADVQDFLLETSILDRFCAPLCDTLTCRSGTGAQPPASSAQSILRYLEESNLFLVPLDDRREWFRYHHLFSDLLRARLQQAHHDRVACLHSRAANWCEENGLVLDAVRYALLAPDYPHAVRLLESQVAAIWAGANIPLMRAIQQIPGEFIQQSPALSIARSWWLVLVGQYPAALFPLDAADRALQDDSSREAQEYRSFSTVVRAYIQELNGQPSEMSAQGRQAIDFLSDGHPGMRNSAGFMLGYVLFIHGQFDESVRTLHEAVQFDLQNNTTNAIPICMARAAKALQHQGRLQEAEQVLSDCIDTINRRGQWRFYLAGLLNIYLADVLYEKNELDEAINQAREGIDRTELWTIPHAFISGYLAVGRARLAKGDLTGATEALEQAVQHAAGVRFFPDLRSSLEACKVTFWLAQGNLPAADQWPQAHADQLCEDGPLAFRQEQDLLTFARIFQAQGQPERAERLSGRVADSARRGGSMQNRVQALALQAVTRQSISGFGTEAALESLGQALELGEPAGFVRSFADLGPPLTPLLIESARRGRQAAYCRRLLGAMGESLPGSDDDGRARVESPLVEPLSERELEVLRLLAGGKSNQEIAETLYLSVGTVKTHAHHIYGKLAVQNRVQAIARSRELGLIE